MTKTTQAADSLLDPSAPRMVSERYWGAVVLRAVPAIAAGVAVTFSGGHSADFGFLVFGLFSLVSGAVVVGGSLATILPGVSRTIFVVNGALSVMAGLVAIVVRADDLNLLVLVVSTWAAVTGFAELYAGIRARRHGQVSKDWVFVGSLTALLAVVAALVPRDLRDTVMGANGVEGYLTASIVLVGAIGAYCAVIAVYLVIAGLSLKWAPRPTAAVAADGVERP